MSYRDEDTLYLGLAIGYLNIAGLSGTAMNILRQIKFAIDKA